MGFVVLKNTKSPAIIEPIDGYGISRSLQYNACGGALS
jgi:hypothetical protein